jgi:hypothetical protein
VETQTIAEIETSPQGIVEQLLEIAKEHDCIGEVGNATLWRWKEGLITCMPKTKTVARLLTAAFKSDKPIDWFKNTSGELRKYIKNNFGLQDFNKLLEGDFIDDIYDSLLIVLLTSGEGRSFDELVYSFCFTRYASSLDPMEFYQKPDEEYVLNTYSTWASKKVLHCLEKMPHKVEQGLYKVEGTNYITSEAHLSNVNYLMALRHRVVGYNSHFDMWRYTYVDLSNEEHIELEKEMIEIYSKFMKKALEKRKLESKFGRVKTSTTRIYGFTAVSIPRGEEVWKWDS